ncbi:MAG TPA: serine/threonine-protein kinase [Micromonosporaceae bacterium]|nr:serine/threonine-protein kinase [Micromonosporaceae bacterium]
MLSPGVLLGGRYRLDERIASGGMGDVWRGTDEVLGRTVAVKALLPALLEEHGFAERFRGEARTMATINHPGVVDIYDYGSDQSVAYLVMEYVEGDALSRTLSRVGRLTPARTMALVAQAADALQAAHDKGIVHRDVKPGNLLVRPNGTLVLTDFGIARSAMVGQLTAVGSVLGTASYLSPEQAAGSVATPASDVYSLGVVAYQCLAGHRPFEGENPLEIALKHVREVPRPLPGDIPPVVRSIVDRAMSKDPAARWPTAATLAAVARQAAATLSATVSVSSGPGGTPISVPPVPSSGAPGRPVSGAPTSPGPMSPPMPVPLPPVGPTRIIGGAAPAPAGGLPRRPTSGPPAPPPVSPGGFVRGAAVVPPPRPLEHTYGYGPATGNTGSQRAPRRTGLLILAIVAAALAILACSVIIGYVVRKAGVGTNASDTQNVVQIPCEQLKKGNAVTAAAELERRGFRVKSVPTSGGRANQIQDIKPCRATAGSEITIVVRTGRD